MLNKGLKRGLKAKKWLPNCGRAVNLRRTDYTEPLMSTEEAREARKSEAVRLDMQPTEVFLGYHITDDQAVEANRLGVRQLLLDRSRRWFPNFEPANHLVNPRVNARLESLAAERLSRLRSREGVLRARWRPGRGFLQNVRDIFRSERSRINQEVADLYGTGMDVQQRRRHISRFVWGGLTPAQQNLVRTQLNGMNVPVPPAAAPYSADEIRLSELNPLQLQQLQTACPFLSAVQPGPMFPSARNIQPVNMFQALVELVNVAGEERKKVLSSTIYDPQRLNQRLDALERNNPNLFSLLVNEVLEDDALYPVENNPEAQALLAYLEWRIEERGTGNLLRELRNIRDNLPQSTEAQEEDEESLEQQRQIERASELANGLSRMHEELAEGYIEAESLGADLYNARSQQFHTLPPSRQAQGQRAPTDTGYREVRKRVADLEKEARNLQNKINKLERKFGHSAREMLTMINTANPIPGTTGPDNPNNLIQFNQSPFGLNPGGAAPAPATPPDLPEQSTQLQLFGPINYPAPSNPDDPSVPRGQRAGDTLQSGFMNGVNALTPSQMNRMVNEIKSQAEERFRPRERINPRQLLFLLKEGDMARNHITNPEMRRSHALLATNLMIADVKNEQLFRQTNQELMEMRAGTILGSHALDRLHKRLSASATGGMLDGLLGRKIFKSRDVIDYIAGFDKDFSIFKGMRRDITLAELRDHIQNSGGISSEKLFEFASKLREVFTGFEMLGQQGRVEFFDDEAVDMENLIRNLMVVREEIRSRNFFESIRGQKGNKAELILRKIREDGEAQDQEEKSILDQVSDRLANWKQWFSRKVLGREFGGKYAEARKFIKEQGMSNTEANEYLSAEGLATAASVLGSAFAAKEWADRSRAAGRWTLSAGGKGSKKLWDRFLRPVGRYGIKKPLEYILWKPASWTLKKAGKIVAFPFTLTGSLVKGYWNWGTGKAK